MIRMGNKSGKHNVQQSGNQNPIFKEVPEPEEIWGEDILRVKTVPLPEFKQEISDLTEQLNLKVAESLKLYDTVLGAESTNSPLCKDLKQNFVDIQDCSADIRKRLHCKWENSNKEEREMISECIIELVNITNKILHDENAFFAKLLVEVERLTGDADYSEQVTGDIVVDAADPAKALCEMRFIEKRKKTMDHDICFNVELHLEVKGMIDEGGKELTAMMQEMFDKA